MKKREGMSQFKLTDERRNKLKDRGWVAKKIKEGETPQEIAGFDEVAMLKFYQTAYQLLSKNRINDAADAFLFLVSINPNRLEYWLGLGMATHQLKDFEGAIDAYEAAALCQLDNPLPYLYLGKCLFAVHDRQNALHAFDLCIEYAADHPMYGEIQRQAVEAKRNLQRD